MTDLDRPRLALYIALGVVVCVLGARYLGVQVSAGGAGPGTGAGGAASARSPGGAQAGEPSGAGAGTGAAGAGTTGAAGDGAATVRVDRADGGHVTVHVAGAVRRPGLYRLPAGSRIDDALRRAGGPARRADLTAVNLATKLDDGRQVLVPERVTARGAGRPPGAAPAAGAGAGAGSTPPRGPVSLNTATLEQLDTLDGVGPGIAQRIIDHREQHGGFRRIEELGEVPGIGPKRLASLTAQVTL